MRLPCIKTDYWELRSAEQSHAENSDTFQIPSAEARSSLQRGDAAKLIFDIEAHDQSGQPVIGGERMWVIVAEQIGDYYLGILENKPPLEPTDEQHLVFGAEFPFLPEHVIQIGHPPKKYQDWQLSQPPERKWPGT